MIGKTTALAWGAAFAVLTAATAIAMPGRAAAADDVFKVGASVGLTGYAASGDRNWRDGLLIAADALNAEGGILGRKVEIVVEDNRSQPQDAVVAYRKMMSSDNVTIFDSGCVSAGNMAAASFVARAKLPMLLCSILPQKPDEQAWAFSFLPPPRFELDARYAYLRDHTSVRKIGILFDATPYSLMMKNIATQEVEKYGIEIVAVESYKQDDADANVQLGRINAAGAGAVVKIGQGGSTVTVAKNIRQLGLDQMLLLASTDDVGVFTAAGEVLGPRFVFVASLVQFGADAVRQTAETPVISAFLKPWTAKYGDRDSGQASRAWDSLMMMARAAAAAKSVDGGALKAAFEQLGHYQGAGAAYDFTEQQHVGIIANPYLIGAISNGRPVIVK